MPTPPLPSRDDDEHGAMPADCRVETLARMLRAAWLQREPVPSAGNFDDLGPIMRQAWMDTGAAVRALVKAKVREAVLLTKSSLEPKVRSVDSIFEQILGSPS